MKASPPSLFLRFFRWFCHPRISYYIEGDLLELYSERLKMTGKRAADVRFAIDVLLLFRPGIIRPLSRNFHLTQSDMLLSYLKTGIRNIQKHKTYASINIAGLSVGIASSLLIMLYALDELSYDKFHRDADSIYRISSLENLQGRESQSAVSSAPIVETLLREVPEISDGTRFGWWRTMPMRYGENAFIERNVLVADANFFTFFSFPVLAGDGKTMLKGVNKVVITRSAALRYFGTEDVIGKTLLRGQSKYATEVTGVIADVPSNSHMQFEMVVSGETWELLRNDHWSNTSLYSYVKLRSPLDAAVVNKKLQRLTEKYMGPELEQILGLSMKEFNAKGNRFDFFLQPMLDIHLKSDMSSELSPGGSLQYLYVFGAIATFLLLIACVNFMNLSTARATTRAKEVGVRKSIGAARSQLIRQFLLESMVYSFVSIVVAMIVVAVLLGPFNTLAGKNIALESLAQPSFLLIILVFTVTLGLVAGSYPAFYLTGFNAINVFRGKLSNGSGNISLRNSLVVFQFIVSTSLILCSIVVYKQLTYMQEKDLGFAKENVIVVNNAWALENNVEAFKHALSQQPAFKSVSISSGVPPNIIDSNLFRKGGTEQDIVLSVCTADYDHMSSMGFVLKEGRFFSPDFPTDTAAIVVNESAFRQFGFDNVNGQTIVNFNAAEPTPMKLIGVIKDFNFENLRSAVKPIAFLLNKGPNRFVVKESYNTLAVRITPGDVPATINALERTWKKYANGAFEFSFLDENIDGMFRSEQRMSKLVFIFAILTIAIACLGLFGLAAYIGEQRGKEIGIRKVLGASVAQVLFQLLKNFGALISIAFVIAAPFGWFLMENWLEDFAYRISVSAWMPLLAGILSLCIALLAVGIHSIKVARQNPVNVLKSE